MAVMNAIARTKPTPGELASAQTSVRCTRAQEVRMEAAQSSGGKVPGESPPSSAGGGVGSSLPLYSGLRRQCLAVQAGIARRHGDSGRVGVKAVQQGEGRKVSGGGSSLLVLVPDHCPPGTVNCQSPVEPVP